jgi:hypothetical protein
MAQQPIDRLSPADIVVEVARNGVREPNCPEDDKDKMKRLRNLLWAGDWSDQDIGLIAWSAEGGCWYMWRS